MKLKAIPLLLLLPALMLVLGACIGMPRHQLDIEGLDWTALAVGIGFLAFVWIVAGSVSAARAPNTRILQKAKGMLVSVGLAIAIAALCGLILIMPSVITRGSARLAEIILPQLSWLLAISASVNLFVLIPLAARKTTRKYAATGCSLSGWAYLFILWLTGVPISIDTVGVGWTFAAMCFLGFGHVLIALIVSLFSGNWVVLFDLVFLIILFGLSETVEAKLKESSS